MISRFELFDHTADMGILAQAPTLSELVGPATEGLYAAIGELVCVDPVERYLFDLQGDGEAFLLRDYLAEVLYRFEQHHQKITRWDVRQFNPHWLSVQALLMAVDMERSVFFREVKAITYHELSIRTVDGGFEATVVIDI